MPTSFLEIVELENGDVALQKADDDQQELVVIHFSDEVKNLLQQDYVHIARGMIQAGLQMAGQIQEEKGDMEEAPKIVH